MRHPWSIARRIAAVHILLMGVIALFSVWAAYLQARDVAMGVEARHVLGVTTLVAQEEAVAAGLRDASAVPALQERIPGWVDEAEVSWMTVMDPAGTRVASWLPSQVGTAYPHPVDRAVAGESWTEVSASGTAGPSVRALVPVRDPATGTVLGVLTMGVQVSELDILTTAQLPRIMLTFAAVGAAGVLVSGFAGRYLHRVTLGRGPEELAEQFLLAGAAMDSVEAGLVVLSPAGEVRLHNDAAARILLPRSPSAPDGGPGLADAAQPVLPEALRAALRSHPEGEFTVAVGDQVLVVQQRLIHARDGRREREAAREGVDTAPPGTRVLTLHDRTDLRRLGDDLSVAHTLTAALRAQTHEHANRLHTALSLVESGRLDAAKGVLARHHRPADEADDVVAALLAAKRAQAAERGVALHHEVTLDGPVPLDPLDLITVVGNLVDNAIDAAAEAGPDGRWVEAEVTADAHGLLVQVADGGAGPGEAESGRLFEQGFSTKPAGPAGRGMGLWLVRRIAEGAGGWVEVAADSGTVFTVEVPGAMPGAAGWREAGHG